jgi:hypothetical protein
MGPRAGEAQLVGGGGCVPAALATSGRGPGSSRAVVYGPSVAMGMTSIPSGRRVG